MVGVERWLSYKGACHVILLAKLHDMYLYKTDTFFHINHYLKSVSKVALLHRFHCTESEGQIRPYPDCLFKAFVVAAYRKTLIRLCRWAGKSEFLHFTYV